MRRRKAAKFASLRDIGKGDLFDPEVRAPFGTLAVFDAWTRSIGPQLRKVTRPLEWNGRNLKVEVTDPIWLTHLEKMQADLLPEVNATLAAGSPSGSRILRIARVVLTPGSGSAGRPPR